MITVATFVKIEQAELARERLAAEGIEAFLPDSTTANVYPALDWASGGIRLTVRDEDADRARQVLETPKSETTLPEDFESAPEELAKAPDPNRLIRRTVFSIAFLILFPFLLVKFWGVCTPLMSTGMLDGWSGDLTYSEAFQISLLVLVVGWMLWWLRPRRRQQQEGDAQPQ